MADRQRRPYLPANAPNVAGPASRCRVNRPGMELTTTTAGPA